MIKKLILFAVLLGIITIFFFPEAVKEYYPNFSSMKFSATMIFFLGCFYAILERSFILGFIAIGVSMVIPWVSRWFEMYWGYIR